MSNNEIIDTLVSNIYKTISQRIRKKKKEKKLTNEELFNTDIPLISRVLNNRVLSKKNPYLLTPTLTQELVKKLDFKSSYELIWEKSYKYNYDPMYGHGLFYQGFKFLLNTSHQDTINNILFSSLSYVQAKIDLDRIKNTEDFSENNDHAIVGRYEFKQDQAISAFIENHKKDLGKLHKDFFSTKTTTKIDKNIKLFFENDFFNYISNYQSWQGQQFYNLLLQLHDFQDSAFIGQADRMDNYLEAHATEIAKMPKEKQELIELGEITDPQFIKKEKMYKKAQNEVIKAGKDYVKTIIQNQKFFNS